MYHFKINYLIMEEKKILEHYCAEDPDLDAVEEIWVYPDYIQYNVEWGWWRKNLWKFEYKVEWKKLFVKAFDYKFYLEDYDCNRTWPFHLIKDWEFNDEEANRFTQWCVDDTKKEIEELKKAGHNPDSDILEALEYADDITDEAEDLAEWHEFKTPDSYTRYSTNAKKWILEKIKNKDFD